jgi:prepilin-type N-terminal cleavage/methylation domain-containing protein
MPRIKLFASFASNLHHSHRFRGFSLVEVLLAVSVFALLVTGLIGGLIYGQQSTSLAGQRARAIMLAEEGLLAVGNIQDFAWNELTLTSTGLNTTSSYWAFNGESTAEAIGDFTRTLTFADVCRDDNDFVTVCPGSYTDVHTRQTTSTTTWQQNTQRTGSVAVTAYLTNWASQNWTQSDWVGGSGQATWSDPTKYFSRDANDYAFVATAGDVSIISGDTTDDAFDISGDSSYDWPFSTTGNYTYDSDKITVTGAFAQLVGTGAEVTSGSTLNPDFDTDTSSWTYADWQQGGGIDVTGARITTGGNPNGYVNVNIPGKKSDTSSGYWQQSFITTKNNPQISTVAFDWIVSAYSSILLNSFKLYVFVDSSAGAPTLGTEVWSSGDITGTTSWTSQSTVDLTSKIGLAGTYYLKIAVQRTTSGGAGTPGTNTAGFDNVDLDWEHTAPASYPTDNPSIYPIASTSVPGITSWASFSETATKNGGEIYYQLSNDNGSTWKYWNGSAWTSVVGATDFNLASTVSANIGSFTIVNAQIKFRAFLESDGTQLVQLDNINIGFNGAGSVWSFASWDVDGGEVTPSGAHQSNGGSTGGYADITVPRGGGDEVGGYWVQPFRTYRDNPTGDNINFDYKIVDFNDTPINADIRVYIDTANGPPTTQVGSSIPFSSESGWISASQLDTSSAITTAGLYYLKMVVWVETSPGGGVNATGPFTVGFDNVNINLGNGEHPESSTLTSSDFDTETGSKIQVIEWDETVPSQTYINKVQIRTAATQAGLDSAEWSGPDGKDGDTTDYFTTARGTLIHTSHNDDRWIRYKIYQSGDGYDTPLFHEIRINYK